MAYKPFEKRTKTEQRQTIVNSLVVWVRIAAQDVARVQLEEMLTENGFHNAHVVLHQMKTARETSEFRNQAFEQAEKLNLVKHT